MDRKSSLWLVGHLGRPGGWENGFGIESDLWKESVLYIYI